MPGTCPAENSELPGIRRTQTVNQPLTGIPPRSSRRAIQKMDRTSGLWPALMAEIAEAIGRADDAANYRGLRAKIRSAFTDAFTSADGQVASGAQTAYALALHMQLMPEDLRERAVGHLVDAIARTGWRLTTGFVGVGYLLPVLSSNGQSGGLPAAGAGSDAVVAVHGQPRRHDDLGTLGRLDR